MAGRNPGTCCTPVPAGTSGNPDFRCPFSTLTVYSDERQHRRGDIASTANTFNYRISPDSEETSEPRERPQSSASFSRSWTRVYGMASSRDLRGDLKFLLCSPLPRLYQCDMCVSPERRHGFRGLSWWIVALFHPFVWRSVCEASVEQQTIKRCEAQDL